MKDLLVYLHVPFCSSKCHFCDWVQEIPVADLRAPRTSPVRSRYIQAICRQIRHHGPDLMRRGYTPRILYWGGGTASILDPDEFAAIATALGGALDLSELGEATIEGSPESLTREKLEAYLDFGFRRISIGVQSLDEARLARIGRAHGVEGAIAGVRLAREAGFENINIDLICGFPGETIAEFERSLRLALDLPANHYSLYSYRPAHGTVMRGQMQRGTSGTVRLDEQLVAYQMGRDILEAAGFEEYALSHFGSPVCSSDMAYFALEMDWIGFGSGATSLIGRRFLSTRRGMISAYIESPSDFDEDIPADSRSVTPRFMYESLSTWRGAEAALWEQRTGADLRRIAEQEEVRSLLDHFRRSGGLVEDDRGIRVPREGIARAFVELQFINGPGRAGAAGGARQAFAGY